MKVRGRRECADCGERWSYFATGGVECPACGSIRSLAIDEGALHTATGAELDLATVIAGIDERSTREVAAQATAVTRSFLADRGFIAAGELQPLDEVTVAAAELRQVADEVRRTMTPDEEVEWYFLVLLRGAADGERPGSVPAPLRPARGLGAAAAVDRYRSDLVRYLDEHPDPDARRHLGILRDHLRRIEALDGDVPAEAADRLVESARAIGEHLRGDEAALARAADRLARL